MTALGTIINRPTMRNGADSQPNTTSTTSTTPVIIDCAIRCAELWSAGFKGTADRGGDGRASRGVLRTALRKPIARSAAQAIHATTAPAGNVNKPGPATTADMYLLGPVAALLMKSAMARAEN